MGIAKGMEFDFLPSANENRLNRRRLGLVRIWKLHLVFLIFLIILVFLE